MNLEFRPCCRPLENTCPERILVDPGKPSPRYRWPNWLLKERFVAHNLKLVSPRHRSPLRFQEKPLWFQIGMATERKRDFPNAFSVITAKADACLGCSIVFSQLAVMAHVHIVHFSTVVWIQCEDTNRGTAENRVIDVRSISRICLRLVTRGCLILRLPPGVLRR